MLNRLPICSDHIHLSPLAREAARQSHPPPHDNSTGHPSVGASTHRRAHADMRLSTCASWSRKVAMCESHRQVAVICHQPASGESLPFRATYFSIHPSPAAMGHRSSRQGVQPIGDDITFLHAAPPRHAPFWSAPRTREMFVVVSPASIRCRWAGAGLSWLYCIRLICPLAVNGPQNHLRCHYLATRARKAPGAFWRPHRRFVSLAGIARRSAR